MARDFTFTNYPLPAAILESIILIGGGNNRSANHPHPSSVPAPLPGMSPRTWQRPRSQVLYRFAATSEKKYTDQPCLNLRPDSSDMSCGHTTFEKYRQRRYS